MELTEKKKKKKRRSRSQQPAILVLRSVFPPMYPAHMGTPRNDPSPPTPPPVVPSESLSRVMSDLGSIFEYAWAGHMAQSAAGLPPQDRGPTNVDVRGAGMGAYDFVNSPGLSFRSAAAWRVWRAALEIIPRSPTLTVAGIIQAALHRAGLRFGEVESGDIRVLEMGIEWYLNTPGVSRLKDGSDGAASIGSVSAGRI